MLLTSLLDALRRGLGDTGRLEGDSPVMTGALAACQSLLPCLDSHLLSSVSGVVRLNCLGPGRPR